MLLEAHQKTLFRNSKTVILDKASFADRAANCTDKLPKIGLKRCKNTFKKSLKATPKGEADSAPENRQNCMARGASRGAPGGLPDAFRTKPGGSRPCSRASQASRDRSGTILATLSGAFLISVPEGSVIFRKSRSVFVLFVSYQIWY